MHAKNTRRDASLSPNVKNKARERNHGAKIFAVAAIISLIIIGGIIGVANRSFNNNGYRHTISVDANPGDWTGTLPGDNQYAISNGEYVWKDTAGDERNDFNNGKPDNRTDLLEFRVTGDSNYIYFMAKFKDLDDNGTLHIGDNGATFMAITIDNGSTGGQTYFAGSSDTQVNSSAAWEYQMVVNLADSRYAGKNLVAVKHPLNESTANWGSIFYVVNSSWEFVTFPGDDGTMGLMAVNLTNDTIEIRLAWSVLGLDPSNLPEIKVEVITARGWSNYANNQGGTWDISNVSDALDCMTTKGPNTWNEVQDGVVNDYATIQFDSSGDVSNGTFIPEFSALILPVVFLAVLALLRRR